MGEVERERGVESSGYRGKWADGEEVGGQERKC